MEEIRELKERAEQMGEITVYSTLISLLGELIGQEKANGSDLVVGKLLHLSDKVLTGELEKEFREHYKDNRSLAEYIGEEIHNIYSEEMEG